MKSFMITVMLLASATLLMAGPLKFADFEDVGCKNDRPEECAEYAAKDGYCEYEKKFMEKHCPLACGMCQPNVPGGPTAVCRDEIEGCAEHKANEGYCDYTSDFMAKHCRKTCGFCLPTGPNGSKDFFWKTTDWGECEQGYKRRGVKCIHIYEEEEFQVDLHYCREELNEVQPADEISC